MCYILVQPCKAWALLPVVGGKVVVKTVRLKRWTDHIRLASIYI